jgi:hypothetical protein
MDLLASYHPGATEPVVVIALALAALWLTVGGFFIVRTIARRPPFTWRLFALHVTCLAGLVLGVRPLEALAVRAYYQATHSPWATVVSAELVQQSWLPYVIALLVLTVVFVATSLRAFARLQAARRRATETHA